MEAGYDYLLLRPRFQQRFIQVSAMSLVIIGAILLSAGIAYFVYAHKARGDLDQLNYTVAASLGSGVSVPTSSKPVATAQNTAELYTVPSLSGPQETGTTSTISAGPAGTLSESPAPPIEPGVAPPVDVVGQSPQTHLSQVILPQAPRLPELTLAQIPVPVQNSPPQVSPSAIAALQPYPAEAIKATYWNNPLEYEPASYIEAVLIQGFKPIDPNRLPPSGTLAPPTRLIIPSIGVDSGVSGLQVMALGDSRAYETPKHVVGHIPEFANPGEKGSTWFFGHLESPIAGEGNVFYNLPKIPDLLRKEQEVYVIAENGVESYLYRIMETRVVHQDDMKLYDTGGATIHLVACVPRLVYDHRLIATGWLVGVRK